MKALRILIIEQFLKAGPETVESLAIKLKLKGFECSNRSIYRDLHVLQDHFNDPQLEIKCVETEFNRKKWVICKKEKGGYDDLDTFLKIFLLDQFTPDWLKELSGGALDKLQLYGFKVPSTSLGSIMSEFPSEAVMHTNWSEFFYSKNTLENTQKILWAIANKKSVRMTHFFHNEWLEHDFKPYRLIYHRGTIHVSGWIIDEKKKTVFSIREIEAINKLEISNERPRINISIREAINEINRRFGIHDTNEQEVKSIKIQMGEGPYLFLSRRIWHPSQKFYRDKKGQCFLELKCAISIELIGWLFSWLEHVKVIRPASLRKSMEERAAFIVKMYRNDLSPVNPTDTNAPFLIGK